MKKSLAFLALAACLSAALASRAAPPVTVRLVAEGLAQPVAITHAGDGSGRLFVVEKVGRIRIVRGGTVGAVPFLDLTNRVSTNSERGLLGLAFHPGYAQNGRFFVYYTRPDGALRVSGFRVSATDPDRADDTEQALFTIPHPGADNHNGGNLAFGPDGFLYAGTGDGGGSGDPGNNAQNPGSLLGKFLRIDVDASVPAPQIWASGLRNPWRFSFDRATGDLFLGDVGQNRFEEINYAAAGTGQGRNYGWRVIEGSACFNPPTACSLPGATAPVLTYGRELGQSITGGFVYRGLKSRELYGYYLYGDFESNRVWALRQEPTAWVNQQVIAPGSALSGITTFGEDESGEMYVSSFNNSRLFAIEGPATARTALGVASGLWWNPQESGWGVQFTQRGDAIFATIYNYGPDGQPKWYIASNCARLPATNAAALRCEGDLYEVDGPRFFGAPFDPAALHITTVGRLSVDFRDSERATMRFNVGAITRNVAIERQVFRGRSVALLTDHTDLYFNTAEQGWGLAVSHQSDILFVTWYVYDSAGRPEWYVASSCAVNGNGCAGQVFRVTGPPLATGFDPGQVRSTAVGQIALAFQGTDSLTITYTVNGISGTKQLVRQVF